MEKYGTSLGQRSLPQQAVSHLCIYFSIAAHLYFSIRQICISPISTPTFVPQMPEYISSAGVFVFACISGSALIGEQLPAW